jgi:hypothetical protein
LNNQNQYEVKVFNIMRNSISEEIITSFKQQLETHPVYGSIRTREDLVCFMEHHVYSVWDFMSLIKYLQSKVAPDEYPWLPVGDASVRRFINELVLEEESDQALPGSSHNGFSSHFELYCDAMKEIGGSPHDVLAFIEKIKTDGINIALASAAIPEPSRIFTRTTFKFIESDKPHVVAAALALGREHIIPCMFRSFLQKIGIAEQGAPAFHYYLNRHIHLDEDFHAPLSLRLLNVLCGEDKIKQNEAIDAARASVTARLKFWDMVLEAIEENRERIKAG